MLDIRYHIVYLCAIFLMLGFGILIGESLVQTAQVRQQARSLAALQYQVNGALQQGREAQSQLTKMEGAVSDLRPSLVHGKLAGKRVVLIQTGDYAEATQAANGALSDAGAQVAATVLINTKLAGLPQSSDIPEQTTLPAALASLAQALVKGTTADPSYLQSRQSLESRDFVTITGDLTSPCTLFVLVGGGKEDATQGDGSDSAALDTQLISQLQTVSGGAATIVGCEPLGAVQSYVPNYQNAGVATVDCIDEPLGQLALPFALRGGADSDDYGLKSTAARQVPASLQEAANS